MWTECKSEGSSKSLFFFSFFICPPTLGSWLIFQFFAKGLHHNKGFCGRKLPSLVRTLPGLSANVTHSAAVFPALSLSLPFSIIHASVSPESRRNKLFHCFCRTAGVFLAQEKSQQELHAAMKRCCAVVNSSISEGMSAAILEVNIFRAHGKLDSSISWFQQFSR